MLMMDPETKYAAIGTVAGTEAYDSMPDMYSAAMLFVEPDTSMRRVVQAWIGINMWPKMSPDNEASFDSSNPSQTREIQIDFSGVYQYGPGVDYFAQKFLDSIKLIGADQFHQKAALDGVDAMVANSHQSFSDTVRSVSKQAFR